MAIRPRYRLIQLGQHRLRHLLAAPNPVEGNGTGTLEGGFLAGQAVGGTALRIFNILRQVICHQQYAIR